jgi:hypothetical protein
MTVISSRRTKVSARRRKGAASSPRNRPRPTPMASPTRILAVKLIAGAGRPPLDVAERVPSARESNRDGGVRPFKIL